MAAPQTRTLVIADEEHTAAIGRCIQRADPNAHLLQARADEAVAAVERLRPDVVLVASGIALVGALRAQHAELPIVAVVGDEDELEGARALDQGATEVIVERELEPHLLTWRLRLAVDRHEAGVVSARPSGSPRARARTRPSSSRT